ncbi:uncharacterized protein pprc1 [Misgurnus anguillicaudatus]|uniref:uncharacterized protein pprc1 n=1 Tax=Misgurnus anguillicaudatus TaxID=75329 RepID=UPI003CCF7776
MAARWGTGEEMLTACNTQIFSTMSFDEADLLQESFSASCLEYHSLNDADALDAVHGCLDPSILSIFEDNPTGEVKSNIDEESEVTLLTALTEILDNVDDDNLSPFDTLPDSDLFSGQKGQDHLPMKKFLSRPSLEKESLIHTRPFPGKTLPRIQRASQQNSEGEEEDGDSFPSPIGNIDLPLLDGFDWCLPVSLEQDGDGMSVTLGDLVKQMHPYCMTLCMEGEEGQEHLLPEGGIVLEVVDQGEHGEPILAIPDLRLPLPPCTNSAEGEQRVPVKSTDEPEPKPKEDQAVSEVSAKEEEKVVVKSHKNKSSDKCNSRKKKKKEKIEATLVKQRVTKSSSTKVKEEKQQEGQKIKNVTTSAACLSADPGSPTPEHSTGSMAPEPQVGKEDTMTCQADKGITESKPEDKPMPVEESTDAEPSSKQEPASEQPAVCQNNEIKPKPLSLQQYRLLRQQKKPDPINKNEDYSTKWPTLPEAPKELPPIPCLPESNLKDPRKTQFTPFKKDLGPEIMPAWHPRGPAAPPTPEALLIPPASMLASSKKPVPSKLAHPTSCTSAPPQPSPSTSPQKVPSDASLPAVQPSSLNSPQKPIGAPPNTIQTETSNPIRQVAPERTTSLPTIPGDSRSLNSPSLKECLNRKPCADRVVEEMPVAPSKLSESLKPQAVIKSSSTTQVQSSKSPSHNAAVPVKKETKQAVLASASDQGKNTLSNLKKLTTQPRVSPIAAQPFISAQVQARVVELAEQMRMASSGVPKPKNTDELIESFTSEIGIEASDLTSLLEQFEESQSKEEQSVAEVCGRAAAVGNSSFEPQVKTKALEKTKNHDLGSTAGLTPPATPPHQMWKPVAPVALLEKTRKLDITKTTPNKVIQIEPRPLPSNKLRSKPPTTTTTGQIQPFSLDHDYCLPPKEPQQNEVGNRWNVKQQPSIIIKTVELSSNKVPQHSIPKTPSVTEEPPKNPSLSQSSVDKRDALKSSVLETPDASPNRPDCESSLLTEAKGNQTISLSYSESSSRQCQQKRGRSRRRYRARSSSSSQSSSASSSRSRSPPRKRYRSSSRSSSSSRSCSRSSSRSYSPPRRRRYSYSSSRSGSWSRSRSRSRSRSSDLHGRRHWRSNRSPNQRSGCRYSRSHSEDSRRRKEKAIEERRIVYVGRISGNMTRKELKERFSFFGEIEDCTVHFRENGDNYGFITYYNTKNAFDAIENGSRLREPNELPFDLCFGGRRQFCKTSYADLDSNREYEPMPSKGKFDALDFDTLLKQAQKNLKR